MAFNRLLRFHVVRSTRPCVFIPACFLGQKAYRTPRDPGHIERNPKYPDPKYFLNYTQKYMFRHASLRHLRVEQFNRYLSPSESNNAKEAQTAEDTIEDVPEDAPPTNIHHRNYDKLMEGTAPGKHFPSTAQHLPGCKRRMNSRLGVSRTPMIEPVGPSREMFYEAKLLLALPWFCEELPQTSGDGTDSEWTFQCNLPVDELEPLKLKVGGDSNVSFEVMCQQLETRFCATELNLVCRCCAKEIRGSPCKSCVHATGFHRCCNPHADDGPNFRWRKGTLFAGTLDIQRVLYNLYRKMLPKKALEERASEYVKAGHIDQSTVNRVLKCIEIERGTETHLNEGTGNEVQDAAVANAKLSPAALKALLKSREEMMKAGAGGSGVTDQFRVYQHIVHCLETDSYLRLMVQASAGTGKSFLLNTVFLYCLVHGIRCKAAAPTGIAAANIEIPGTDVRASTLHALFEFDHEYKTKIDFTKQVQSVVDLLHLKALLLDEVSMIDEACFSGIEDVLSIIDHTRRPNARTVIDCFGPLHVVLFGGDRVSLIVVRLRFLNDLSACSFVALNPNHACIVPKVKHSRF